MDKSDVMSVSWTLPRLYASRLAAPLPVICVGALAEAAGLVLLSGCVAP